MVPPLSGKLFTPKGHPFIKAVSLYCCWLLRKLLLGWGRTCTVYRNIKPEEAEKVLIHSNIRGAQERLNLSGSWWSSATEWVTSKQDQAGAGTHCFPKQEQWHQHVSVSHCQWGLYLLFSILSNLPCWLTSCKQQGLGSWSSLDSRRLCMFTLGKFPSHPCSSVFRVPFLQFSPFHLLGFTLSQTLCKPCSEPVFYLEF